MAVKKGTINGMKATKIIMDEAHDYMGGIRDCEELYEKYLGLREVAEEYSAKVSRDAFFEELNN